MNKIRVIDLLNKIANGEEVPKKIKFNGFIWNYDIYNKRYCDGKHLLFNVLGNYKGIILNDEVEVIEEDKKIERINILNCDNYVKKENYETILTMQEIVLDIQTLRHKINEIIVLLNKE